MASSATNWKPATSWKPALLPLGLRLFRSPNAALRLATSKLTRHPAARRFSRYTASLPFYKRSRRLLRSPLVTAANIGGNIGGAAWTGYEVGKRWASRKTVPGPGPR